MPQNDFCLSLKKFPGGAPGIDPRESKINDKCIEHMLREFMQTLTDRTATQSDAPRIR